MTKQIHMLPEKFSDIYMNIYKEKMDNKDVFSAINNIIDYLEEHDKKFDKHLSEESLFITDHLQKECKLVRTSMSGPEHTPQDATKCLYCERKFQGESERQQHYQSEHPEKFEHTQQDENIKLEVIYDGGVWYKVETNAVGGNKEAERIKSHIEKALEFYEKYKDSVIDPGLWNNTTKTMDSRPTIVSTQPEQDTKAEDSKQEDWETSFDTIMDQLQLATYTTLTGKLKQHISKWISQARKEMFTKDDIEVLIYSLNKYFHDIETVYTPNREQLLSKLEQLKNEIS